MLTDRPLLALCFGLLLCCSLGPQSTGLPQKTLQADTFENPAFRSLFVSRKVCANGTVATGDTGLCRKVA